MRCITTILAAGLTAITIATQPAEAQQDPRTLIELNKTELAPMLVHSILERRECRGMDVTFRAGQTENFVLLGHDTGKPAMLMVVDDRPLWANMTNAWRNLAKDLCNCLMHRNCDDVRQVGRDSPYGAE